MTVPRRVSYYPRRDGKKPASVAYVGRPSRHANPHPIGKPCPVGCAGKVHDRAEALRLHREDYFAGLLGIGVTDVLELAGYEALGCACPLGEPCHADLYIEIIRSYQETTP